jgi:hypothetical protein
MRSLALAAGACAFVSKYAIADDLAAAVAQGLRATPRADATSLRESLAHVNARKVGRCLIPAACIFARLPAT